jgi:glycosyltransferase involved in cell wall biosynthesis
LRLAILGTRGVPPRYGGFETFAAELGRRLVLRGHQVTVYCRTAASDQRPATGESIATWNGITCVHLPALRHKYLETVSHAMLSGLDALRRDFDVVLVCNAANAFVLQLLKAARIPLAINVDGIERKRRKWNLLGKAVYAMGESLSVIFANRVIADAQVIADYYGATYSAQPVVIPYGSELAHDADSDVLERLGIEPDRYVLYVSRFEPENNPLEVARAFRSVRAEVPLVMVGEARYDHRLGEQLRALASDRIFLPGALYGADYRTLQRHALVYIQATEVGGTHPALIEAMGSGGCVLAHDTPENREVGGDAVGYFDLRPFETLSGKLSECLSNPAEREAMRGKARLRAAENYGWEGVTDAYERLFAELA